MCDTVSNCTPERSPNFANSTQGQNGNNKQKNVTPANTSKPVEADSLIAQIKRAESQPEPDAATPSKKRKADDAEEDVKKPKKEKKEKDGVGEGEKEKKKKKKKEVKEEGETSAEKEVVSAEWSDETLDVDFAKTVPLAVRSVLDKVCIPGIAFAGDAGCAQLVTIITVITGEGDVFQTIEKEGHQEVL